ncbi:polysaccharide deacetylase family protein [Paenibacillus crassostreae]|uniref:NodB homology domain-containing protein n=1 Tax=Paenibacillus crassostreae TaxID=1763538 RepID=A0A167GSA1_9BACL|nr:polysaccharide deacetylase family protein [Paenibacillus crassostreae]AOZ92045.1 hypothetical protein LPB68_07300 [Paenibacillus crassostreae]OAB77854.1 hypothetical protein PNBC_00380 [Paenibacillus crassostreae]
MDKESGNHYIQVKFTFGQTYLLQWEVDSYTAEQIIAIYNQSDQRKYRLSLQSYSNPADNHYYSHLTEYDRENSNKMMFLCSESYKEKISSLKNLEHPDQLKLIFPVNLNTLQHVSKANKELFPFFTSRIAVLTVIMTICSFVYVPNYNTYISEKVFAKVTTVLESAEPSPLEPLVNLENTDSDILIPVEETTVSIPIPAVLTSEEPKLSEPPIVELDKLINFSVPSGYVALTFDDGPSMYTQDIAKVLQKYKVGGTFFFVGTQVKKFPDEVKLVDDYGFSIGNHSMTHPNLSSLSAAMQRSELEQTNQWIEDITSKPVLLFRPPYGSRDDRLTELTTTMNMKMILWNSDPEDWHNDSSQQTLNYITQTQSTGSIILLHESKETLKILPLIIEFLQKQQLQIANIK